MLPPHVCLEKLDAAGISQNDISIKVGIDQSSVSRIKRQLFKRPSWQAVERIQSLYQHVCIKKESLDAFLDYNEYMKLDQQIISQQTEEA